MRGIARGLDVTMALLFALATAVQFNDPDPWPWVALYGAVCTLSVTVALGRPAPGYIVATVAFAALAWGALIVAGGPGATAYGRMFEAWEMESVEVEEAREAIGLFIAAGWMAALLLRGRRRPTPAAS